MPRMRRSSKAGLMLLGLGRHDEQPPELPTVDYSQPAINAAKRSFHAADISSSSSSSVSSTASSSPSNSEPASPIYAAASLPTASFFHHGVVPTSAPSATHQHSAFIHRRGSVVECSYRHMPSLDEVLANESVSPFTLTEFMAYLAQNHCLETLEFTMDVQRYCGVYENALTMSLVEDEHIREITSEHREYDHLMLLWHRIVDSYIRPESPRELNLPATVRDDLLSLLSSSVNPPHPAMLAESISAAKDLMNESVYMRFLNDAHAQVMNDDVESNTVASSVSSASTTHGLWRFPSLHRPTTSASGIPRNRVNSRSQNGIAPDQQLHLESEDDSWSSSKSSPASPPDSPEYEMLDEDVHASHARSGPWRKMSKRFKWRSGSAGLE
ncbi:RGS domain-containing protein [Kockiozyma suomiensis]|uniref:RGS domain-containing protein n=1 Tax=Kockiozyma suomiensis TaxID=1337062 RepID=UPI0033441835